MDAQTSYRKTIFFALFATFLTALIGIVLLQFHWLPSLLFLAMAVLFGLIVLGGMIGLRRDALETLGVPYYSFQRRERLTGEFSLRRKILTMLGVSGRFHPGEWVTVRPFTEISGTLDEAGKLDGLPFMPEMVENCGKRFRVYRRVEKIHNYFTPDESPHLRRLSDAVLLVHWSGDEARCNGMSHGGCQAGCQIIWKEAWLKIYSGGKVTYEIGANPEWLNDLTQRPRAPLDMLSEPIYVCQMTELPKATVRLGWNDPRHWLRDLWTGNVRPRLFVTAVSLKLFNLVQGKLRRPLMPRRDPAVGKSDAPEILDLQPGEMVRVRTKREIEQTLNSASKNRGLWFDVEMHRFCGGVFRVQSSVRTIIDEATGKMLTMKRPCIVLEKVSATGEYLSLCPQNELIYWREAWLQRITLGK